MTSLESVVRKAAKSHGIDIRATRVMEQSSESKFLKELHEFGVITIGDLENLINGYPFDKFKEFKSGTTVIGLSRSLMMYTDAQKYFSECFHGQYRITQTTVDFLNTTLKGTDVPKLLEDCNVGILNRRKPRDESST
jgi:hypothetical protein